MRTEYEIAIEYTPIKKADEWDFTSKHYRRLQKKADRHELREYNGSLIWGMKDVRKKAMFYFVSKDRMRNFLAFIKDLQDKDEMSVCCMQIDWRKRSRC